MKRGILTLVTLVCLAALSGCAVTDTSQIKLVVKQYNKNLVSALEHGNAQSLTDCATERQQGRVYVFIGELAKNNRLLRAELVDLKIKEVSKVTAKDVEQLYNQRKERLEKNNLYVIPIEVSDKPHAVLKARETWMYTYIDRENKKPVSEREKISYDTAYYLVLQDGKWLVDNLDAIEVSSAN